MLVFLYVCMDLGFAHDPMESSISHFTEKQVTSNITRGWLLMNEKLF